MYADRLDALARALLSASSRRSLPGLGLAGVLAALGLTTADAKNMNKNKKKKCPPCMKRKKGKGKCKLVRCGGTTCPRCANGKRCTSRDDCQSAMCNLQTSICEACTSSADCGEDSFGPCPCYTTTQGANVCSKGGIPQSVASCTLCPAPNNCVQLGNDLFCVGLCAT
jgi:hypothetical protein